MKTKLLKKWRKEAYQRVKINEYPTDRNSISAFDKYYEINEYGEELIRMEGVYDRKYEMFTSRHKDSTGMLNQRFYDLDLAIMHLKDARRSFIINKLLSMKYQIKSKKAEEERKKRVEYLHSF